MIKENKPLVTAIVLNFNNGDLIFETLKSVLMQDYANIELIVSDDCSDFFKEEEIRNYVKDRMHENIKRFLINKNKKNLGTVKHLETIREMTTGEIEICIAADDCWAYKSVFSDFIKKFNELGPEAEWITSQIEMRDEKLEKLNSMFITADVSCFLKCGDMKKLLDVELERCALPGPGSAFRKSFFKKIGQLSNDYYVVEDYPAHLRWLRMKHQVYYLDRVTLLHRHGGISHGNNLNTKDIFTKYIHDSVTIFKNEIEPFKDTFSVHSYQNAKSKYDFNIRTYMTLLHPIAVIVLHFRPNRSGWMTINSILHQDIWSSEIIIGTRKNDVDLLINHLNEMRFEQSNNQSRIKRFDHIQIIVNKESLKDEEYLTALSTFISRPSYQLAISNGEILQNNRVLAELTFQFSQEESDLKEIITERDIAKLRDLEDAGISKTITHNLPLYLIKAKLIEFSTLKEIKFSLFLSLILIIAATMIKTNEASITFTLLKRMLLVLATLELILSLIKSVLKLGIHIYRMPAQ